MDIYKEFAHWLDRLLTENTIPDAAAAFNFNLYEESESESLYAVQLIAAGEFDENDDEWACDEVWSSEEDLFFIDFSDEEAPDRKRCLDVVSGFISDYLANGSRASVLISSKAVGVGFVDGDLKILYKG